MPTAPPRDGEFTRPRDLARMSRVRVRTAMGGLLALVMMSTVPVRAAEPDRQDKQPLYARTSPGSPIHLVVRGADRGVNNDSDYTRGMMGNNPLAVKGLPWEEALSANQGDRQSFYLNRTAMIVGQLQAQLVAL